MVETRRRHLDNTDRTASWIARHHNKDHLDPHKINRRLDPIINLAALLLSNDFIWNSYFIIT